MSAAIQIPDSRRFTLIAELPEGLHRQVPAAAYHVPVLGMGSKSALEALDRSPAHYRAWLDGQVKKDDSTGALAFGSAFHCAILEPDVFPTEYAVAPDFGDLRTKLGKERRDAWKAEHAGLKMLDADDYAAIVGMTASLRAHPLAAAALKDGEAELTAIWKDKESGIRYRARADKYVPRLRMVLDVKTCEDARAYQFAKAAFRYRYHWQHAIYRSGFAHVGETVEHFVFLAVEKTPPFAVAVHQLDDEGVRIGHSRVRSLNLTMAECLATDSWPAYAAHITTLETPRWAEGEGT